MTQILCNSCLASPRAFKHGDIAASLNVLCKDFMREDALLKALLNLAEPEAGVSKFVVPNYPKFLTSE